MTRISAAAFISLWCAVAPLAGAEEPTSRLLADLTDPDFKRREAASRALIALGPEAAPAVQAHYRESQELEGKLLCREILDAWGMLPDEGEADIAKAREGLLGDKTARLASFDLLSRWLDSRRVFQVLQETLASPGSAPVVTGPDAEAVVGRPTTLRISLTGGSSEGWVQVPRYRPGRATVRGFAIRPTSFYSAPGLTIRCSSGYSAFNHGDAPDRRLAALLGGCRWLKPGECLAVLEQEWSPSQPGLHTLWWHATSPLSPGSFAVRLPHGEIRMKAAPLERDFTRTILCVPVEAGTWEGLSLALAAPPPGRRGGSDPLRLTMALANRQDDPGEPKEVNWISPSASPAWFLLLDGKRDAPADLGAAALPYGSLHHPEADFTIPQTEPQPSGPILFTKKILRPGQEEHLEGTLPASLPPGDYRLVVGLFPDRFPGRKGIDEPDDGPCPQIWTEPVPFHVPRNGPR